MANRTKATDRAREQFLAVLRTTCNVSEACRACGFSRSCAYENRNADPEFSRAWDEAEQEAADRLEREAWRRAVEGVDKPITYQGEVVGYTKEYSDRMLELLLKAHRPEKFREGQSATNVLIDNRRDDLWRLSPVEREQRLLAIQQQLRLSPESQAILEETVAGLRVPEQTAAEPPPRLGQQLGRSNR